MNNNIIKLVDLDKIDENNYSFRGAEAVILTQDNKIILQKRGDNWDRFPGYLTSFGGEIEQGETPEQAIIRELNEELGAKVKKEDLIKFGAVTESVTNHSELIYVYFWHDKNGTITGCYEGGVKYFDNIQEIISQPKVMDATRWALNRLLEMEVI